MRVDVKTYIDCIDFDQSAVFKAIGKMKSNLASRPDNLPPLLFKNIKNISFSFLCLYHFRFENQRGFR